MSKNLPPAKSRARVRVQTIITEPSMTKQSFGPECNINTILSRYAKSGVIEHLNNREGFYGDFAEIPDYQTALDIVYTAEDQFLQLPAQVRKFFNNDPSFMLAYMQDPKNKKTCQTLGLLPADPKSPAEESKGSTNSAATKQEPPATPAPSQA